MPIFEYKCNNCNKKFEVLHKSIANIEIVKCPECDSQDNNKLFSAFAPSMNSKSESFCNDGSCSAYNQCASGNCALAD